MYDDYQESPTLTNGTQWFLKYIQPAKAKLDKSYINIYTFLCMMITKHP